MTSEIKIGLMSLRIERNSNNNYIPENNYCCAIIKMSIIKCKEVSVVKLLGFFIQDL